MAERIILWNVTDPRGLNITLTDDVWESHLSSHPELDGHVETVRRCVQDPDEIYFDQSFNEDQETKRQGLFLLQAGFVKWQI